MLWVRSRASGEPMVPIKRVICWWNEKGAGSALTCWEQLEGHESGRGRDPAGTAATHRRIFLQLPSGSSVYFSQAVRVAARPARSHGTFTTVVHGQTWTDPLLQRPESRRRRGARSLARCEGLSRHVWHYGTVSFLLGRRDTHRSHLGREMQRCRWSDEVQKKHIWTCPKRRPTQILYTTK